MHSHYYFWNVYLHLSFKYLESVIKASLINENKTLWIRFSKYINVNVCKFCLCPVHVIMTKVAKETDTLWWNGHRLPVLSSYTMIWSSLALLFKSHVIVTFPRTFNLHLSFLRLFRDDMTGLKTFTGTGMNIRKDLETYPASSGQVRASLISRKLH